MENVQETWKNRLQTLLTRSRSCEIEMSEFFNISNEVGRVKRDFELLSRPCLHTPSVGAVAPGSWSCPLPVQPTRSSRLTHQLGVAHQTSLRSLRDHDDAFELRASRGGRQPIQPPGHCTTGPLLKPGIPARAPPLFCRSCPRRQNSW